MTPDGAIAIANPAAADLLDRDAGAMAGMSVERAFVHGGGHPKAGQPLPILAQFKSGPFYTEQEAHLTRSDGASFEAIYVVAPIGERDEIQGYVLSPAIPADELVTLVRRGKLLEDEPPPVRTAAR